MIKNMFGELIKLILNLKYSKKLTKSTATSKESTADLQKREEILDQDKIVEIISKIGLTEEVEQDAEGEDHGEDDGCMMVGSHFDSWNSGSRGRLLVC